MAKKMSKAQARKMLKDAKIKLIKVCVNDVLETDWATYKKLDAAIREITKVIIKLK